MLTRRKYGGGVGGGGNVLVFLGVIWNLDSGDFGEAGEISDLRWRAPLEFE